MCMSVGGDAWVCMGTFMVAYHLSPLSENFTFPSLPSSFSLHLPSSSPTFPSCVSFGMGS